MIPDVQFVSSNLVSNVSPNFARLPKSELQKFNGNPLHFHSLWDSFGSAVGENDSLNQLTKFNYLKASLTDEFMYCYSVSLTNFKSAVELLKKLFADTQVIISTNSTLCYLLNMPLPLMTFCAGGKFMMRWIFKLEIYFPST